MSKSRNHKLPFRQVHLDFHTSSDIPGVGELFDKQQWQDVLKRGHVNSITLFSKCHHGFSYHPTKIGKRHPHLTFDLLRAQINACNEIGIKTPVYLSAGYDELAASEHPDWREQRYGWKIDVRAGFYLKEMCFHSPYLDYLRGQIKETVTLFPEANGIFLDIIRQGQCVCQYCLNVMKREGLNAQDEADRLKCSQIAVNRYYEEATAAAKFNNRNMPVFHNSGHIARGHRDVVANDSHLELESLPTGGWGYDHFPMSAAYCRTLGLEVLGQTGKFHTTWGEFGGFKHPKALRFECNAMIAQGAKCSVGDQLHPSGKLDVSTYRIIGNAYQEIEAKEPWCEDAVNVSDAAILSANATRGGKRGDDHSDVGAARILLESHVLFDILDQHSTMEGYKLLIVPEDCLLNKSLLARIHTHLASGGKLLICGQAAFDQDGRALFDFGVAHAVPSEFEPDYILPKEAFRPSFISSPFVMYFRGMRIKVGKGAKSLGQVFDPYFNRSYEHFCSHQHAPPRVSPSGFDCGAFKGNILYLAHPAFTIYRGFGAVAMREYIANCLRSLMGEDSLTVKTNMPSSGRITLTYQKSARRYILHAFYANISSRGGKIDLSGGTTENRTDGIGVIDELLPLVDIEFSVRVPGKVKKLTSEPDGAVISFENRNGFVTFKLDRLVCHQMIVVQLR